MLCIIDGQACDETPTHRYFWAWGEEGVCCDKHRATLEGRSVQLGRSISFSALRAPYEPPKLTPLDPEMAELKLSLGAAKEIIKKQAARIQELETALRDADTPVETG